MKKITFLVPPPLVDNKVPDRVAGCAHVVYDVPNIFILLQAAVLREKGFDVAYVDFPVIRKDKEDFINFLKSDSSDSYIFYTVNLAIETDIKAVELIRNVRGQIPVAFLGPSPTCWPERFLKDEYIYVIRGEPELSLADLAERLKSRADISDIKGISFKNNGKIFNNSPRPLIENLDILPLPARDLIDKNRYFNPKLKLRPLTIVLTSRGCPHRCIFCVPCSINFAVELEYKRYFNKKSPTRLRSVHNIVEEFKLLKLQGYRAVSIWDDQFVHGKERTIEICRNIKSLGLAWGCQSRADYLLDGRLLKEMSEAGCKYIDIGVESFCQDILDYIKKDMSVEVLQNAIKLVKKYNIAAKINVMFGASPLETKDTIRHTQKIIRQLNVAQVMYNICNPFPGTEIYDIAKREGWFVKNDYEPSNVAKKAIISLPALSSKDLELSVKKANIAFFLSPKFIIKNIFKTGICNLTGLKDSVRALKNKLFL